MLVRELPADVRPREKLLARGAGALADAELVAVLLGTGVRGLPVLALAQRLLDDFGGPAGLLHAGEAGLRSAKGLGPAKRAQLAAVVELTRRALDQRLAVGDAFASPAAVKDYVRLQIGALPHEVFAVLYLDAQNRLLKLEELFRGTLTQANVYPREVVLRALALKAAAVIFAHNHPSGEAEPSQADRRLTRSLMQALALVDVRVLDHLVVAQGAAVSFAERGWL